MDKIDVFHRCLKMSTNLVNVLSIYLFFCQQFPLHIVTENGYTFTVEVIATDNAGGSVYHVLF